MITPSVAIVSLIVGTVAGWLYGRSFWKRRFDDAALDWQGRLNVRDRELGARKVRAAQTAEELATLRAQLKLVEDQTEGLRQSANDAQTEFTSSQKTLLSLTDQLHAMERNMAESHAELTRKDQELLELLDRADAAETQAALAQNQIQETNIRLTETEGELTRMSGRLREFAGVQKVLDSQRERIQMLEEEHRNEINDREGQIGLLCQRVKELEVLEPLRDEIEQREARIRELEERVAGYAMVHETMQDDLKQIRGVGAKLERKLNELGYRRFMDLAALSEEDVETLGDRLKVPKRIDDWVVQAQQLHHAKYGSNGHTPAS